MDKATRSVFFTESDMQDIDFDMEIGLPRGYDVEYQGEVRGGQEEYING